MAVPVSTVIGTANLTYLKVATGGSFHLSRDLKRNKWTKLLSYGNVATFNCVANIKLRHLNTQKISLKNVSITNEPKFFLARTITLLLFMLFIPDSLQKYIQSCHNIYCLPLLLLYHSENCNKHVLFWHWTVLRISPVAPSSPSVPTQHQYWSPQAWRQPVVRGVEKEILIWTHSDHTQRITQVHTADWHAENKRFWYARMKRVRT